MNRLRASLLALSLTVVVMAVAPIDAAAPQPTISTQVAVTTSTVSTTTTSIEAPASPPDAARCPAWWSLAASIGFSDDELLTLDRIMFRESRCDPTQINATDPNGGSLGLTQINRFWCLPSRYYPDGYLQTVGVLGSCDDLYLPEVNLRAALALVIYSRSVGLDGWAQWAWL
jgi:hypothetical protein